MNSSSDSFDCIQPNNNNLRMRIEQELLPFVEKPMRYIGNEINCIHKDLREISLHGVLCFADIYDIGMSHYGTQILYHCVNSNKKWALSRAYHPWIDAEKLMREKQIPLFTLEYFSACKDADWIGFSVQHELHYTNILNMLDLSGIPLLSSERGETDPLIIAGGPSMSNPEPMAEFFDIVVLGDGEDSIRELCTELERAKQQSLPRKSMIEHLANIDGVYVPQLWDIIHTKRFITPVCRKKQSKASIAKTGALSEATIVKKPIVPLMETVHTRLTIEVMRGCTRGCRFCAAGYFYRPVRQRTVDSIIDQIARGISETGHEEVGLLSLSTADYSDFRLLLQRLHSLQNQMHFRLSLPSLRLDALTPTDMQVLNSVTFSTSLTIAPEAATQRLRNVINKDFTHETIMESIAILAESNLQTLKLYFMVGLPTETDEDIEAIIQVVSTIAELLWKKSKKREIHVALSPFSPKPHTPFQWEALESMESVKSKSNHVKQSLKRYKNVKVSYRDPGMTFLETLLCRGDRAVGKVISQAWKQGALFDGWDEHCNIQRWLDAADTVQVAVENYVTAIPLDEPLPWDHISIGIERSFLEEERQQAYQGLTTKDCRTDTCNHCGLSSLVKTCHEAKPQDQNQTVLTEPGINQSIINKNSAGVPNNEHYCYRITYSKLHPVRFLSHRNCADILLRCFKASGLPLAYSQGFHPLPRVAFGPPLAVGIVGEAELLDIQTTQPICFDTAHFSTWLPQGMSIQGITEISRKHVSLMQDIVAGVYRFISLKEISIETLQEAGERFANASTVIVQREVHEQKSQRDIKSAVQSIHVFVEKEVKGFDAVIGLQSPHTCKPQELIDWLLPDSGKGDFLIHRVRCILNSV